MKGGLIIQVGIHSGLGMQTVCNIKNDEMEVVNLVNNLGREIGFSPLGV